MLGPVIPGVLKAMVASQMERILPFPTSCLQSRCGGSLDPDRQLFVPSWLEGFQAFLLKKTGFLCPSCVMKEGKLLIPLALQGAHLSKSGQGYQHLHRFDSWFILRSFFFVFLSSPRIPVNEFLWITSLGLKIYWWELIGLGL